MGLNWRIKIEGWTEKDVERSSCCLIMLQLRRRTELNHENITVKLVGRPAEIWTEPLPNASQLGRSSVLFMDVSRSNFGWRPRHSSSG
jgi:hypothetical protein